MCSAALQYFQFTTNLLAALHIHCVMQRYLYENLEKHFTAPKTISPFYNDKIKIPRKLKKKVKMFCDVHWDSLTNGQRLWCYMESSNPDYKRYLIKMICTHYNVA